MKPMKREYLLPQNMRPLDLERAHAVFRLRLAYENHTGRKAVDVVEKVLVCASCGKTEGVALEPSRTAYVIHCPKIGCGACEGLDSPCKAGVTNKRECPNWPKEDPNAPILLCRECAEEHHANWDNIWADYYAGFSG